MSGKINKLYINAGKYDNQLQYTDILEAKMVSIPEECNDNSPMTPKKIESTKNPSARIVRQFSDTLDVKHNTAVSRLCTAKEKYKVIRTGDVLWTNISKHRGHTKINQKVREAVYNWILHHPQIVQFTISNYCLCVYIDGNSKIN